MLKLFEVSFVLILVVGCSSAKSKKHNSDLNDLIFNKLGNNVTKSFNLNNDHLLAFQNSDANNLTIKYLVINMTNTKVLLQGSFNPGYIKWNGNYSLELQNIPGIIPKEKKLSDYIEIIRLPSNR